ncbi:ABC transporter permease [Microbacterium sp. W4I20]|uniref:ABC transporter permease n=1 Tax=Microbacterium sp. W4I20 TaxID=3042262 RepID=UPI0027809B09|nr:ABC transporter permease [Microbacterium sp. W4I20]MDQ0727681.1 ribose transport system permease protein [Microbacterium sp. W4I20]
MSRFASTVRAEVRSPRALLLVLIVALVVTLAVLKPAFLNGPFVIAPLLTSIAIFTVVGLSQMVVLSVGHMNLAVGQLAGVGALVMGASFENLGLPLVAGLALGLLVSTGLGALAGWIIAKTGVNSFIVTLAMSFALLGLIPTLYKAWSSGQAFTVLPDGFETVGRSTFADVCLLGYCGTNAIPLMILPALACMAAVWYFYTCTRHGREVLVTGSNVRTAELSGVPTARRIILAHALSGLLAAGAGFLLAASTGSFTPAIGSEFMLSSFLGPILGGTLLAGGVVSIVGTALGITLTSVIRKGLELFGVGLEALNVLLGCILLAALATDRLRLVFARRRPRPREESAATLAAELEDAEAVR